MNDNELKESRQIVIKFGTEISTTYHLGYVLEDITKLVVLANSLRPGDFHAPMNRSSFLYSPLNLRRNDPRIGPLLDALRIERAQSGCIELFMDAANLAAAVVVPLVIMLVAQRDKELTFEVRCTHAGLDGLLRRYASGDFGGGQDGLNHLFIHLAQMGLDVKASGMETFVINALVESYTAKIGRVLKIRRRP